MTVLKREEKNVKGIGGWDQAPAPELAAAMLKQHTLSAIGNTGKLKCRMMNDR
jgi:hypothetical protein